MGSLVDCDVLDIYFRGKVVLLCLLLPLDAQYGAVVCLVLSSGNLSLRCLLDPRYRGRATTSLSIHGERSRWYVVILLVFSDMF